MIWNLPRLNPSDIDFFSQKYGVDRFSSALLLRRGIVDSDQLKFFLSDDLKLLHSPFYFSQMDAAVDRITAAVSKGEKVLVFGDRDVDGITATVLLVSALRNEQLEVFWKLPMGDEPYALNRSVIDDHLKKDVTLCITVDCGINNVDEIAWAKTQGMDSIIIDHHNQGEKLPDAFAIINPKCFSDQYPFEGLSACTLVLKFLTAIDISKSTFFNQDICLLNLRPGNESIIIEVVQMNNMTECSRLSETIVRGSGKEQLVRIIDFIKDYPLIVYQKELKLKLLSELFGEATQFELIDISEEIWNHFPALKDKTLLSMLQASKLKKFSTHTVQEIDAMVHLVTSYFYVTNPHILENLRNRLDITTLGIIADMMPLWDENRIMIRHGLKMISETQRKGLRELMARLGILGHPVRAPDIAWYLTPSLNSTGRMGKPDLAVQLLLEEGDVVQLADTIFSLNAKRKQLCNHAWRAVLPEARKSMSQYANAITCVLHESVHRGITGLLASGLSKELRVPAFVIASLDDDGYVGSVRSVRGFHVTDFLSMFADILDNYGGHDVAGGFRFRKERLTDFLRALKEKALFIELAKEEDHSLNIDIELQPTELTEELEQFQASFEPTGQKFKQIHFMMQNVQVLSTQVIGKNARHLRMLLAIAHRKWRAIYWSGAERFEKEFDLTTRIDCVFTLERNYFGNNSTLQLNILDMRPHET